MPSGHRRTPAGEVGTDRAWRRRRGGWTICGVGVAAGGLCIITAPIVAGRADRGGRRGVEHDRL